MDDDRGYYGLPMLKQPVWKWEIATYFFLGGLSGGSYVLARTARRLGGKRLRRVSRVGTYIALGSLLPCPVLLTMELGDPKRFLHMLRVFKPGSPMNLGSWTLTAYGGVVSLAALLEFLDGRGRGQSLPLRLGRSAAGLLLDGAGVPLGLMMAGYTGVLLSTTANPVWAQNEWLGPLFSAGGIHTAVSAISLALRLSGSGEVPAAMDAVETATGVAEAASLGGYLAKAGRLARPLTRGRYAPLLWGGAVGVGLVLPALLKHFPAKSKKTRRVLGIASAVASLAGGLAMRWAVLYAGHASAKDPQAARDASRRR